MKPKEYHNLTNHPLYGVWDAMRQRCTNPKSQRFKCYGARGIEVCDKWLNSFKSFYDWAIGNGYQQGLTIDRIDNNSNYQPSNCRWVTNRRQANNKSSTTYIEYQGQTKTLVEWCNELDIDYRLAANRLRTRKWPIDKIFRTEKGKHVKSFGKKLTDNDVSEIKELAKTNIKRIELANRFNISRVYLRQLINGEYRNVIK